MKKLTSGIFVIFFVFISSFAQASLVEISANPSVGAGIKAFVPTVPGNGFPTPFYNIPGAPAAENNFTMQNDVRVATQLDLTQIVLGLDANDPASDLAGGFYGNSYLDWTYTFQSLFDATLSYTGHVGYAWSSVKTAQDNGLLQVNFVSDDFFTNNIMDRGEWEVTSYLEGQVVSSTQFSVPEPASLALFGLGGLLLLGRRRAKK